MDRRIIFGIGATAIALVGLAGCAGADGPSGADDDGPAGSTSSPEADATQETALATAESDLGTIIVDGDGRTVYLFDEDTQGADASSCEGQCAANWPAVHGDDPMVADDIAGEIGSITGVDGEPQLTLDGWPLYTFAGDEAAGDVAGQGLMDSWWVLSPDGEPIRG